MVKRTSIFIPGCFVEKAEDSWFFYYYIQNRKIKRFYRKDFQYLSCKFHRIDNEIADILDEISFILTEFEFYLIEKSKNNVFI